MSKINQTVLLSGINGFIGSHTAILLLNKGYKVIGTYRDRSKKENIISLIQDHAPVENLELIRCELMDSSDWKHAAQNVDYIQHIASPVPSKQPKDRNILILPAREGVINVLKAAKFNKVKRVVITSSVAAIGYGTRDKNRLFNEQDWTNIDDKKDVTAYIESKTLAEKAAWDFMENSKPTFELAVINPSYVFGPILGKNYSASTLVIKKILDGDMPGAPKMGFGIVDVRDVADLHLKAMEHPDASSKRFICCGGYATVMDIANILKESYPEKAKRVPKFTLPNDIVRFFSLFDKETAGVLNELSVKREFDNSLAVKTLGWSPRSVEDAINSTAGSMIKFGFV